MVQVLIPEGWRIGQIADKLADLDLVDRDRFISLTMTGTFQYDFLPDRPAGGEIEGYLFPDTYGFTRTQTMEDIVATMVRRFKQEARAIGLSSDVHRTVTLAAIVEKETAAPEERPVVASVYLNRLHKGMALDADPSVIYAAHLAGRYEGTIYQSDLKYDSPYNTYRYSGLPPGPIANPGRASLEAAMHPAQTEYLFFVSDNNGHHRFARTMDEHAHNVALYRRAVAASR
jgi:UPF0755 protein